MQDLYLSIGGKKKFWYLEEINLFGDFSTLKISVYRTSPAHMFWYTVGMTSAAGHLLIMRKSVI